MEGQKKTSEAQIKAVRKYEAEHMTAISYRFKKELVQAAQEKSRASGISIRSVIEKALIEFINN